MPAQFNYFLGSARAPRLLAYIVVIAVTASILDRVVPERPITVTARFAVSGQVPTNTQPKGGAALVESAIDSFRKSEIALLMSNHLLSSAIKTANLNSLAIFQNRRDPVVWLRKHLEIVFQDDGEVLAISMAGVNSQKRDLVATVNAVASTYSEALTIQQEMSPLLVRDILARSLPNLNVVIRRKVEEYEQIERESGPQQPEDNDPALTLDTNQILAEMNRLQHALSDIAASNDAHLHGNRDELRNRLTVYNNALKHRIERPTTLAVRKNDIHQQQVVAEDMAAKLEKFDQHPPNILRIRQMQPATVAND